MKTISVIRRKRIGHVTVELKVLNIGDHVPDCGIRYGVERYDDRGWGSMNIFMQHSDAAAAYRAAEA